VVELRYSLVHIHYTIQHHVLKLLQIILALTVPSVVILSLKKIQCRRGMSYAKISEEIKWASARNLEKERKKKSETRGKNGQVSRVELGVQRYPLERENGQVGVCTTHLKKKRKR